MAWQISRNCCRSKINAHVMDCGRNVVIIVHRLKPLVQFLERLGQSVNGDEYATCTKAHKQNLQGSDDKDKKESLPSRRAYPSSRMQS